MDQNLRAHCPSEGLRSGTRALVRLSWDLLPYLPAPRIPLLVQVKRPSGCPVSVGWVLGQRCSIDPPKAIPLAASAAAATCRACELWRKGTQTAFGEGSPKAAVMLVGEQPADREDLTGHPFVGPAGGLLDKALAKSGIAREDVYLTNVVRHFNWEARGKRLIHRKPNLTHIRACRLWLDAEIKVGPRGPGAARRDRRP